MIYDISPPIDSRLAVWPGDTPATREVLADLSRGDNLTLSTLRATVHLGAHADAPSHYGLDAPTIEQRDLDLYIGPCQVMRVDVTGGARIAARHLTGEIVEERVIFATGSYPDPAKFEEDFVAIEPDLVRDLAQRGVRLVGIDTPSVDTASSKRLPAHQAFLECDMAILEGLVLAGVPAGSYELVALPLRLVGFDASPVRAILRSRG